MAGWVLMVGVAIGAQSVAAQGPIVVERPPTVKGFFMVGWHGLDLGDLNDRMSVNGFPSSSENVLSLGGGGWVIKNRFLIGGEGHALLGSEETTTDGAFETRLNGGYGQLDLGYRAYSTERLDVYPIIGLGGGTISVDLIERGTPTFDEILADPLTSTKLTADGFLLDLSVAMDVRLTMSDEEDGGQNGLAVGLRAGYTYSPNDWDWKVNNDTDAPGGPEIGVRGAYLRLMFGGWGRRGSNGG
jgi:hypothetical protein